MGTVPVFSQPLKRQLRVAMAGSKPKHQTEKEGSGEEEAAPQEGSTPSAPASAGGIAAEGEWLSLWAWLGAFLFLSCLVLGDFVRGLLRGW